MYCETALSSAVKPANETRGLLAARFATGNPSVDPASLNSYEDALQWLSSQGLPVAKRAASKPRVSFAGFTAEDKAVSQYMNKYFGSTEGMTVDQLRQVYGDNNVNAVIKKLKG